MNKNELKQMALHIKEKRKTYGYTQEEMAEQLGLSYSYYTKIENGCQTPSLDTLIKIASTLQLSMDKLVFDNSREIHPFSPDTQELVQSITTSDRDELIRFRNLLNQVISFLS